MSDPVTQITQPPQIPQAEITPVASEPASPLGRIRSLWHFWTREIFTGSEDRLFLFLAILIGVFSGLAVVCFRVAIEWTQFAVLGSTLAPTVPRVFLAPAIAGLGIAVLVMKVFPQSRGSGVNQTKAAVYVLNGYISFKTVIGKFIVCALAIGSGQSLGPEDPVIADRRRDRLRDRPVPEALAEKDSPDRTRGRRGGPRCGFQRAYFGGRVRH